MASLKRLEGAKDAYQDDYLSGTGLFTVKYENAPAVKPSAVARQLGRYKLERVRAKFAATIEEKDGAKRAAGYRLSKNDDEDLVAALKPGTRYALVGVVTEDDKGNPTLAVTKAEPAPH